MFAGSRSSADIATVWPHPTGKPPKDVGLLSPFFAEPDEEKEMFALQRQLLEEWVADQVEAYRLDRQSEKDRRLLDKSRYFDES